MRCYDPAEQIFVVGNEIISIDWGKNGDKSIRVKARKENDGTLTILEVKELSI